MTHAFIGLGSNLEDPRKQITRAFRELAELPSTELLARSRLYASRAHGPVQPDYLNAAVLIDTQLDAHALLDELQALEQLHRRVRLEHWGPRTLDLDLLLFGNEIIQTERLSVPHPFLTQRNFVLYPLADIDPELILPSGAALRELVTHIGSDGLAVID